MSSRLLNLSDRGQISLPAEIRHRWQIRRVLLTDDGESVTLRPIPDDPVAAVTGKYAHLPLDSDRTRDDDRRAEGQGENW